MKIKRQTIFLIVGLALLAISGFLFTRRAIPVASQSQAVALADWIYGSGGNLNVMVTYPEKLETVVESHDRSMIEAAARAAIGHYCDAYAEIAFADMAAARARCLLKPVLWRVKLLAKELDRRGRMTVLQVVEAMYPEHTARKETQPCPSLSDAPAAALASALP